MFLYILKAMDMIKDCILKKNIISYYHYMLIFVLNVYFKNEILI